MGAIQKFIILLTAAAIGSGVGYQSAEIVANNGFGAAELQSVGPWQTAPDAGGAGRSAEARAYIARTGILALSSEEAVYFFTFTDNDGAPLRNHCNYEITMPRAEAAWSSLAAYDSNFILMENAVDRYSVTSEDLLQTGGNIIASRQVRGGAWLPLGDSEYFNLTYRVYLPKAGFDQYDIRSLPRVSLLGACDA